VLVTEKQLRNNINNHWSKLGLMKYYLYAGLLKKLEKEKEKERKNENL